jgi:hypothetical protein
MSRTYNVLGWPKNPRQVQEMLAVLVELYPTVTPRTLHKGMARERIESRESAAVSVGFHDDVIDSIEMEIGHNFIESGIVLGQPEWELKSSMPDLSNFDIECEGPFPVADVYPK